MNVLRRLIQFLAPYLPKTIRKRMLYLSRLVLVPGQLTYNQDGLATMNNCDFMKDSKFMRAYLAGEKTGSWNYTGTNTPAKIHWRAHVICWAAFMSARLAGDFVECGVNKGGFSSMIVNYLNFSTLNKKFYLLDTYHGIPLESVSPGESRKEGRYTECYAEVVARFRKFKNVKIVRGIIPESLTQVPSKQIAFLSLDLNCAKPEVATMEYFWEKLTPGAMVVLDDYGFPGHLLQKTDLDSFARRKKTQILSLPTGQGLIIKL